MFRQLRRPVAAAVLAALWLAACGQAASPASQASGKPATLTVNWTAVTGANSGLWTAYFKAENLDVQLTHVASSSRAIPALVAEEVQLSTADGLNLVQAVGTGADVKAVLGATNRLVFSVMASPKIQTPRTSRARSWASLGLAPRHTLPRSRPCASGACSRTAT